MQESILLLNSYLSDSFILRKPPEINANHLKYFLALYCIQLGEHVWLNFKSKKGQLNQGTK